MIVLIISIVANFIVAFLAEYCSDRPKLWGKNQNPYLTMPSLDDFCQLGERESEFKREIDKTNYAAKVIAPSYHYFKTLEEIEAKQQDKHYCSILLLFFLIVTYIPPVSFFIKSNFEYWLLYSAAAIIFLIVCDRLIFFIYNHSKLKMDDFNLDLEEFKHQCRQSYISDKINHHLEFDVEEKKHINNRIINAHYNYLKSIKEVVDFRYSVRNIVGAVIGIIYILFFFSTPNHYK